MVMHRPSFPQALADCCEGRDVHCWQFRDPELANDAEPEPGDGALEMMPEWLMLPTILQMFIDKHFAAYKAKLHQARALFEKGSLKQNKFDQIEKDCIRPMVIMHGTGQPATSKYVKDHLQFDTNGAMRLKAPFHKLDPEYLDFLKQAMVIPSF